MTRWTDSTRFAPVVFGALALLTGACTPEASLSPTDTTAGDTAAFSPLGLSQAQSEFAQSGLRIEARVKPGSSPLVASELALGPANMAGEPEQIHANISTASFGGATESLTLDLGGLQVGIDGATTFSRDDHDGTLTADEFKAAVNAALAAGRRPHIVARRSPPESPQAVDNGAFLASHIRIGEAGDVLKIDLNVGPANLQLNLTPPPDAFLKLLGLTIEIRISDGTTRIGRRQDPVGVQVPFGGRVKSVNAERNAFVLESGAIVRVTNQTVIVPTDGIATLADVADALAAGAAVESEGVGAVVSREPRILAALKVRFVKHRPLFEFRDLVKAADVDGRKITLANGATLCFNDQSVISQDGDLKSLEQVARALAANLRVAAAGVATPNALATTSNAAVCRATVLKVRFTLVPPPALEFRDLVKAVDVEHRRITLAVGATICLDEHSVISQEGDLKTLEEVARALAANLRVGAAGSATPGPYEKDCRATVLRVRFSLATTG